MRGHLNSLARKLEPVSRKNELASTVRALISSIYICYQTLIIVHSNAIISPFPVSIVDECKLTVNFRLMTIGLNDLFHSIYYEIKKNYSAN